ncbi:MAG TPA: hypothetical protein VMB25_19910 [Bryobacteraceae bacterium]|nr:hypothetical protein [Bryobacteraceae bacterium]
MKATLWAVLLSAAICCAQDTEVSKQSLHGTISNLDPEPAPYVPNNALRYAATPTPSLREIRRESAPGPTLGEITDFQETYGLPVFGQGNLFGAYGVYPGYGYGGYPGYVGNSRPYRPPTRAAVRSEARANVREARTAARPAAHSTARASR